MQEHISSVYEEKYILSMRETECHFPYDLNCDVFTIPTFHWTIYPIWVASHGTP